MLNWLATYGQGVGAIITVVLMVGMFWLKTHLKLNSVETKVTEIKENAIPHIEEKNNQQTVAINGLSTRLNNIDKRVVRIETLLGEIKSGLKNNGFDIPERKTEEP